jgi:RHS repeat-associated protein
MIVLVALGANARSELLRGHVTINERRSDSTAKPAASKTSSDLATKYGSAASSPAVAEAIKKTESTPNALTVADRQEALAHGVWKPGADPRLAIVYGNVPPGMSQQQAAMLYQALPHLPRVPEPITAENADRYAGVPDPEAGLPQGLSRETIQSANGQMLSGYMRESFGPVSVPPLHRDHNGVAMVKVAQDHSGSIREMTNSSGSIVYQQAYDPYGNATQLQGSGPQPDFGYQDYYVHQRSGLNLATYRAYNPKLGRWMNRDPIQDPTFRMMPRSPQAPDPESMAQMTPAIQLAAMTRPTSVDHADNNNPYTYVLNDPIDRGDPSGLKADSERCVPCPKGCDNSYNVTIPDNCTEATRTGKDPNGNPTTSITIYFTTNGHIYQALSYGDAAQRAKDGRPTCYWQRTQ